MRDVKRGERMRDNIFDESRLIFEALLSQKGCAFYKSAALHLVGLRF